ncbi:MAG: hypothetical protein EBT20_14950, partial [Alphaproteobacteria bacterium]|nr:hypothetical protein [Alphaproteobacteria bacterium]
MPLDLTEELMTQYGNPGDPAGYAMLDDDDNIVGYVVEGEGNDPREDVTAITYSHYDDLGQFEYIEYEFVKDVGGVEVKYLNTYQFDEQENPIHIGEWKLTPGNLNGDSSAYITVELAEWYIVPEITDHLPDVVWENV